MATYGAPVFATYFLLNPAWSILPGLYAKYHGLELTAIAGIVFLSRILDAVADPVIGLLSDKHRSAGGYRRTWVLVGGMGLVVSGYFLYIPPATVNWLYFLVSLSAFLFCWTMVEVPHLAWGREIAADSAARAKVYGWRAAFIFAGNALFFLIPFLPFLQTREYTPELMKIAFAAGAGLMVVALFMAYSWAPVGLRQESKAFLETDPRRIVMQILSNKPLLHFLVYDFVIEVGFGMWYGLMFLFLASYLGYKDEIAITFLISSVVGALAIPVWIRVVNRFGAQRALIIGLCLYIAAQSLSLGLSPGSSWQSPMILIAAGFVALAVYSAAIPIVLADIADFATWKYKQDFSATYYALYVLMKKSTYAVGVAFAFWILSRFSLDPAADVQQGPAVLGLHIAYSAIPMLLAAIGAFLIWKSPLSANRCKAIRRRIARAETLRSTGVSSFD